MSSNAAGPAELPLEAYLASIASLDGVGPSRLRWLLSLGPPREVWQRIRAARLPSAPAGSGVDGRLRDRWRNQADRLRPADVWRRCESLGIGVVALGGAGYPSALADDLDPPVVLFHRGDPDVLDAPRVAVVGTRRATGYGLGVAERLGADLSDSGVAVVSGLALGIDGAAHRGAVRVAGAAPVAVVGAGLDQPCPSRNRSLARVVAERGVVLSEVPPGVAGAPWRFPVRNRVIAALSDAVVVVESAGAGGSLHTVREAMERDRPVLAVPGPIDATSSDGTNELIRDGALPLLGAEDVLLAIGHVAPRPDAGAGRIGDPRPPPDRHGAVLLEGLGWRPVSTEQLARTSGLGFRELSAALAALEGSGWIARHGAWVERVARPRSETASRDPAGPSDIRSRLPGGA